MSYIGNTPTEVPIQGSDISDDTVTSAEIKAGTIVNSDINASAAIATTKISGAVTSIASHGLATSATTDTTSASNISSGTLPDARFPATLPTASGVNLTALNASNLGSGSIADARVPASAVTQHVTATDTSSIENDILNLAINQAVLNDRVAFNLDNSFIDGFEDDTGITTETNVDRNTTGEYVSSITGIAIDSNTVYLVQSNTTDGSTTFTDDSSNNRTITVNGNTQHDTAVKKTGTSSILFDGSGDYLSVPDSNDFAFSGDHTIEAWVYPTTISGNHRVFATGPDGAWSNVAYQFGKIVPSGSGGSVESQISNNGGTGFTVGPTGSNSIPLNTWTHIALTRSGDTWTHWVNGVSGATATNSATVQNHSANPSIGANTGGSNEFYGNIDFFRVSDIARYSSTFTPSTDVLGQTVSATGTLISDPQTASSSRTSCSGVIIYEDGAGTNTIGTDLKIYFTANNGSNWTEAASYATAVTYSGSKKLVKLGATTVTAGTQVAMKAVWANQSSGKEARLHGWAVNY